MRCILTEENALKLLLMQLFFCRQHTIDDAQVTYIIFLKNDNHHLGSQQGLTFVLISIFNLL
jgi:hypothetical protein